MTCEFNRHRRHYRDPAAAAAQSWPAANWHFSRRWTTPPGEAPQASRATTRIIRSSTDPTILMRPPRSSGPWSSCALQAEVWHERRR
jgi:hypothetical protein